MRLLYGYIILIRVVSALVLVWIAFSHVALDAYVPGATRIFQPFAPALSGTLFGLLAAAHLAPVVRLTWARLRRRLCPPRRGVASEGRRRSRIPLVAWVDSRFGIRGRYFEHLLAGAELAEAAAQTVNLVILAPSGISAAKVRSFAAILATSCMVSPLLMLSNDVVVYVDVVVCVDVFFDFLLSVVWPMAGIVPWLMLIVRCGGAVGDWNHTVEGMALLKSVLAESPIELLVGLVPFVQAHVLLLELERIIRKENRDLFLRHAVVPTGVIEQQHSQLRRDRLPRWVRLLGLALGLGYAAGVLGATLAATQDRCGAQPMCQRQGYPLFSSECSCVLADAGCPGSDFDEDEFAATMRANADSLLVAVVSDCGLTELPASLGELSQLGALEANDNLIETGAGLDAHDSLFIVHLRSNALSEVPKFSDEGNLFMALLGKNPIRALRTDIHDLRNVITFEVMDAALESGELPCEYGSLPFLQFYLSNANVTSLPDRGCFTDWQDSLVMLALNDNNISALPAEFAALDRLQQASLGGNPVCSSSLSIRGALAAADGVCERNCATTCMPWELDNVICSDFRCDTLECGYDAGDCSDSFIAETC